MDNFCEKNIIITGASGGIGRELVLFFAKNGANLILPVRNISKGETLKNEVLALYPNAKITLFEADLSSFSSIENFCELVLCPIDLVINAAGVYHIPKQKTADGLLTEFAVNFAAPVFLSLKILPKMNKGGKIIAVSSISADYFSPKADDLQGIGRSKTAAYGSSKFLLNSAFCFLDERLEIPFVLCHPGISATSLFSPEKGGFGKLFNKIAVPLMRLIFPSPKKASQAVIFAALESSEKGYIAGAGDAFHVWGKPKFYKLKREFLNYSFLRSAVKEIKEKIAKTEFDIFEN